MIFELDRALIYEIIFFMENQDDNSVFDTLKRTIINHEFDVTENDNRYIALPSWKARDGYRLMEHFTASLRNPIVSEELSKALNSGRGVFRLFKNVLSQYPQTEKQWFMYKEREMKKEVIAWYNAYREILGLELIGPEPDDTSSLILEDFFIRDGLISDSEKASSLHKSCMSEKKENRVFEEMNPCVFPGDICLVSETKESDFAGYICACKKNNSSIHISTIEVVPEYRGLGLGETMLSKLMDKINEMKIENITIDVPDGMEKLSQNLQTRGFIPFVKRFIYTNQ
jgi:ribosomal protein S18 acetylase RimI-like enzyme